MQQGRGLPISLCPLFCTSLATELDYFLLNRYLYHQSANTDYWLWGKYNAWATNILLILIKSMNIIIGKAILNRGNRLHQLVVSRSWRYYRRKMVYTTVGERQTNFLVPSVGYEPGKTDLFSCFFLVDQCLYHQSTNSLLIRWILAARKVHFLSNLNTVSKID